MQMQEYKVKCHDQNPYQCTQTSALPKADLGYAFYLLFDPQQTI